jgi:hypothetical protein
VLLDVEALAERRNNGFLAKADSVMELRSILMLSPQVVSVWFMTSVIIEDLAFLPYLSGGHLIVGKEESFNSDKTCALLQGSYPTRQHASTAHNMFDVHCFSANKS